MTSELVKKALPKLPCETPSHERKVYLPPVSVGAKFVLAAVLQFAYGYGKMTFNNCNHLLEEGSCADRTGWRRCEENDEKRRGQ
jgi:hypothetical protein